MPTEAEEPADISPPNTHGRFAFLFSQLNFYRIHVLYFCITPLIFAAIFYASNGETHISFIDALFNCVSALCVCGLATVDLSSLTPWQQFLLFFQMCIGNPPVVSWVVVFARRRLFMRQCKEIVDNIHTAKALDNNGVPRVRVRRRRLFSRFQRGESMLSRTINDATSSPNHKDRNDQSRKVRADMIRRMDDAPKLVNPSGWISAGSPSRPVQPRELSVSPSPDEPSTNVTGDEKLDTTLPSNTSDDKLHSPESPQTPITRGRAVSVDVEGYRPKHQDLSRVLSIEHVPVPRTQTVEFAPEPMRSRRASVAPSVRRAPTIPEAHDLYRQNSISSSRAGQGTVRHTASYNGATYTDDFTPNAMDTGFGFFPLPHQLIGRFLDRVFPRAKHTLTRTLTIPNTQTILSHTGAHPREGTRFVPYISFDAIVGHNSVFHKLTHKQLSELGGIEYRGLTTLLWLIPLYTFGVVILAFIIIAPYMSLVSQWQPIFRPPEQHNFVSPSWFSLFQVVSAFTNTGMSLVDQSMIPFQRAYPMILALVYLILAGNTAFPVFLRFGIWLLSKAVPSRSSLYQTLQFLLDHPRRCYIYLFPSHQTWFLLLVVICLNLTDWVFFLVLDIGNPEIEAIPVGVRMIDGLLASAAVRSSGFAIVSIAGLAPAVRVAYVIMMYISVYPIAMSVRSTNVYEDRSLGIYEDDQASDAEEAEHPYIHAKRMAIWGRHLAMHMRNQLSFDMWWLALALFIVCIIERGELNKADSQFEIFTILFELVSAYGGVGLSVGLPNANYSTSGAFRTLSKLVVCAVMLRGRHRGLPVAIDRAVVLPFEFKTDQPSEPGETEMRMVPTWMTSSTGRGYMNSGASDIRRRT